MSRATFLVRVLTSSLLAVATTPLLATTAADDAKIEKRAYDLILAVPAISNAQGAVSAAELRKAELDEEVQRFGEMVAAHAISGERLDEVKRDAAIAGATRDESRAKLTRAQLDKQRLESEAACDAGSCAALKQAYVALRQQDAEIARQAVVKLDAQITYQQVLVTGHQALADDGAIDQRVVWEDRQELAALQAERDAAETAYEQLRGN